MVAWNKWMIETNQVQCLIQRQQLDCVVFGFLSPTIYYSTSERMFQRDKNQEPLVFWTLER